VFTGTQKRIRIIKNEISEADALIERIENECGYKIEMFEFGPGAAVSYFKKDKPVDDEEFLGQLYESLMSMSWKGRISLEMGRYIAASCGSYITKIMDMKTNRGINYLICDGGIHQVNYFGQMMAMKRPHLAHFPEREGVEENWNLCGSLCTVNDVLLKQLPVKELQVGDTFAFFRTGAYSVTEGMALFLSRELPAVYLKDGEDLICLRERQETDGINGAALSGGRHKI
jgi:diaminopimelate decarboxylase